MEEKWQGARIIYLGHDGRQTTCEASKWSIMIRQQDKGSAVILHLYHASVPSHRGRAIMGCQMVVVYLIGESRPVNEGTQISC
jgi:hypothetical protein